MLVFFLLDLLFQSFICLCLTNKFLFKDSVLILQFRLLLLNFFYCSFKFIDLLLKYGLFLFNELDSHDFFFCLRSSLRDLIFESHNFLIKSLFILIKCLKFRLLFVSKSLKLMVFLFYCVHFPNLSFKFLVLKKHSLKRIIAYCFLVVFSFFDSIDHLIKIVQKFFVFLLFLLNLSL